MKPKDLKFPFRWEERRPYLGDQVLFIPDYYTTYEVWTFPGWKAIFGNDRPVVIEYCSGNGTWICDRAKKFPHFNWVAVEWRFERVRKIWSKAKNYGLSNLWVVCGEALTFTEAYVPSSSISNIFVNFPDPWPKLKHAKNRLFQSPFEKQLARILASKGELVVVTDDEPYGKQIVETLSQWNHLCVPEIPEYGTSYFDSLWRDKGRSIYYHRFTK